MSAGSISDTGSSLIDMEEPLRQARSLMVGIEMLGLACNVDLAHDAVHAIAAAAIAELDSAVGIWDRSRMRLGAEPERAESGQPRTPA